MASITQDGPNWRVQIRRKGYPAQSKTFPSFTKAKAWATEIEARMSDDSFRVRAETTLRPLLERYRDEVAPKFKGGRQRVIRIDRLLRDLPFLDTPMSMDLSPEIRKYRDKRLKSITYRKRPISTDTVRQELCLIGVVIQHAKEEWGLKGGNPVRDVKLPPKAKRRNRRPTQDELDALYTACSFDGVRLPRKRKGRVIDTVGWLIALAVETAMRLGELTALDVKDVHVEERYVQLHDTKNGDAREVTLNKRAAELFERLVEGRTEGSVFGTTSERAGAVYRKICKKVGIKNLRFHDLRHEAITRITNRVKNAAQACVFSGHRDPRSLMGYYHPSRSERAAILDGTGPQASPAAAP